MKIEQIVLYHAPIRLKHPFITSLGYRDHAHNVWVKVRTAGGTEGWGECSPYPPINGETVDTCLAVGKLLAEQLIGREAGDIAGISALMDRLIYANTSIKSAIDVALHDIASKDQGMPLYRFLGGEITKKVYTDYTVSLSDVNQMVADALRVKAQGFPVIKVKLGDDGKSDTERIRAIREAVGDDIQIRIDANQGWAVQEAITTLKALASYDIQYCEAPIPRHEYFRLKAVREKSPVRIMADESCCDHHDADQLIRMGSCDFINIKLGKSSGLYKARKIVQRATQAGMKMQIGGFLESRILFTASCHLAHTSALISYFDFDSPLFLETDPVIGGMEYGMDGQVILPEAPGLGLHVPEHYLKPLDQLIIK